MTNLKDIEADKATLELIQEYKRLDERAKKIKARQDVIKELLKDVMADGNIGHYTHEGVNVVTYFVRPTSSFQRKEAEKVLGAETVSSFYKTGESKVLQFS